MPTGRCSSCGGVEADPGSCSRCVPVLEVLGAEVDAPVAEDAASSRSPWMLPVAGVLAVLALSAVGSIAFSGPGSPDGPPAEGAAALPTSTAPPPGVASTVSTQVTYDDRPDWAVTASAARVASDLTLVAVDDVGSVWRAPLAGGEFAEASPPGNGGFLINSQPVLLWGGVLGAAEWLSLDSLERHRFRGPVLGVTDDETVVVWASELEEVTADGRIIRSWDSPVNEWAQGEPVAVAGRTVLHAGFGGVYGLDLDTGESRRLGLGRLLAADGDQIAVTSCDDRLSCQLLLTTVDDAVPRPVSAPDRLPEPDEGHRAGEPDPPLQALTKQVLTSRNVIGRFSPDGTRLALFATAAGPDGLGGVIVVVDTESASVMQGAVVPPDQTGTELWVSLAWSPDSQGLVLPRGEHVHVADRDLQTMEVVNGLLPRGRVRYLLDT